MNMELAYQSYERLMEFGERYRADAETRARIARGDVSELGMDLPEGTEIRIMQQTSDTYYFSLPVSPSKELADEALESMSGGTTGAVPSTFGSVFDQTFGIASVGPGRSSP